MDYRERIVHGDEALPVEIYDIHPDYVRYKMQLHWHPEHEILYVRRGHITVHLDDEAYSLRTGDVLFIQGGSIHSADPEDCDYVCILINLELMMKRSDACMSFASRLGHGDAFIHRHLGGSESEYAALCEQMREVLYTDAEAYPFLIKGLIFSFFGTLIRRGDYTVPRSGRSLASPTASRLKTVIAWMEENCASALSLAECSHRADMTPNHFCRVFKKYTGTTPIAYLTAYRLSKAQYALRSTDMSVTEIAMATGFGDASHFIRLFRETYGTTPLAYRRCGASENE